MLSFVLYAQGDENSLSDAIDVVASALNQLGSEGIDSEVIVIDATASDVVHAQLAAADGIQVIAAGDNPAENWKLGVARAQGEIVWLGVDTVSLNTSEVLSQTQELQAAATPKLLATANYLISSQELLSAGVFAGSRYSDPFGVLTDVNQRVGESRTRQPAGPYPDMSQARIEVESPESLTIGTRSYAGTGTLIKSWAVLSRIEIGSYCSFSSEVRILHPGSGKRRYYDALGKDVSFVPAGEHRLQTATTFPIGVLVPGAPFDGIRSDDPIHDDPLVIGNDVWMGFGAIVMGGVTVGDGAIISAGSVVLQDVPAYAIVAGNPGKVVKMRFSSGAVERLQKLKWWEWPEDRVLDNWYWFTRPINEFLDHFDPQ